MCSPPDELCNDCSCRHQLAADDRLCTVSTQLLATHALVCSHCQEINCPVKTASRGLCKEPQLIQIQVPTCIGQCGKPSGFIALKDWLPMICAALQHHKTRKFLNIMTILQLLMPTSIGSVQSSLHPCLQPMAKCLLLTIRRQPVPVQDILADAHTACTHGNMHNSSYNDRRPAPILQPSIQS